MTPLLPPFTRAPFASIEYALDRVFCCDALDLLRSLPDASVDAVITDPPYNGVKDDAWDNQWANDDDFITWVGELCREWRRVLKANGSLYVFASPRMAARVEVEIARWFNVLNRITWRKSEGWHNKIDKDTMRAYFPASEAIVFAEQKSAGTEYQSADDDIRGYVLRPLKDWFRSRASEFNIERAKLNNAIGSANSGGGMATHYFGSGKLFELPTDQMYAKMQAAFPDAFNREYEDLRREYEDLRREYEDLRRPFNASPYTPYTDVWEFATVGAYDGKHPAEKPLKLMEHIVLTSSRPGDVVLDCFAGSGTTLDAARRHGRRFIGCDFTPQWTAYAAKRATLPYTLPLFANYAHPFAADESESA